MELNAGSWSLDLYSLSHGLFHWPQGSREHHISDSSLLHVSPSPPSLPILALTAPPLGSLPRLFLKMATLSTPFLAMYPHHADGKLLVCAFISPTLPQGDALRQDSVRLILVSSVLSLEFGEQDELVPSPLKLSLKNYSPQSHVIRRQLC